MIEKYAQTLCALKQEFAKKYTGTSHIQEIIPTSSTDEFPFPQDDIDALHNFAKKNPIYGNSYEQKILDVSCMVYEGDINEYWLNSIKHGSSCQPFYPTWILSAYLMALTAKELGFRELVDIGSGDGRIAYCGKILKMDSHGIEIDDVLVDLQKVVVSSTGINFNPNCADALEFDYSSFNFTSPVFFIGGLSQMGGDVLATSIIEKINSISNLKQTTCIVFAGSHSKRQLSGNQKSGGWSGLIEKHNLIELKTILLPTVWTFDQDLDTPYIFTKFI
ncbi:hypothetical protein NsoK4_04050 [Nitrosopumilus sp. K4]|uniref:hypothetical protein n=1 Tax=Nitrosopumilus sp. K4 TaxID=2795383 RepID=UPI001BAB27C7|nr:hypothetical protein [Nitrosopumilus sp. K4]QUC65425.1 hypothetical protein NsoK4_04050 [Nitrosopumilus sp. K4]